jgi:ankyrin repeat protein
MRAALKNLATGSEAYDHAYEDVMERINGQIKDQEELAKQVLSWITCAKRQLTTIELQHALGVEVGESELDEENFSQIEDIVSACAGLVTIDEESGIIRLVHYTTQEYFERTQSQWFPNTHTNITIICVSYLSFNEFESGICQNDEEFEQRLQLNTLYDYAAHNWGHHAREASKLIPEVISFLERKSQVEASSQGLLTRKKYSSDMKYSQRFPKDMTGLHLAAYFGIEAVVPLLLATGKVDADSKDEDGRTPLSYAAEKGHDGVVKLLLATGKVDADSKATSWHSAGRTPLSYAAAKGHESVVKLLLATGKVDVDSKGRSGQTPLLYAAEKGHDGVVKLLLATGKVDVDSKDEDGWTPLPYAAAKGHESVVKLLLATGKVDVDSKDEDGWTPLPYAAEKGHESVVKLLLATGKVDVDSKDEDGRTPLLYAAEKGHESVVKLLLATGKVDVDSKDEDGQTPLLYAAAKGHESVVKLLLATGKVDIDLKGNSGQTPLSYAAKNGHDGIIQLLLEKGASATAANTNRDMPPR